MPTSLCSHCGNHVTALRPLAEVVSNKFTGWDHYGTTPQHVLVCCRCEWAFAGDRVRTHAWVITAPGRRPGAALAAHRDAAGFIASLTSPLPDDACMVLPTLGRRHAMPYAQWGCVSLDGRPLPWGHAAAQAARHVRRLDLLEVPLAAVFDPAPPTAVLVAAPPSRRSEILQIWEHLEPWRLDRDYLTVAIRCAASRQSGRRPGPAPDRGEAR